MPTRIHPAVKNPQDIDVPIALTEENHMTFVGAGKDSWSDIRPGAPESPVFA